MTDPGSGLVCSYLFDGAGKGKPCTWEDIRSWKPEDGVIWVHLERDFEDTKNWLYNEANIDRLAIDALVAEETRPRFTKHEDGMLLFLRGVNLLLGGDPEDMISIRIWIEDHRIISVRLRRSMAIRDIREAIAAGKGPQDQGDFVVMISSFLFARMEPVLTGMEDNLDTIEQTVLTGDLENLRREIAHLRIRSTILKRYIAPQREVMLGLCNAHIHWVTNDHKSHLQENHEHLTRYVEALDMIRERATIIQDEISNTMSERLNKNMYLLSLLTAIFLPLGFMTGLFGINIGGLPGVNNPHAFLYFMLGLAMSTGVMVYLFWLYLARKK